MNYISTAYRVLLLLQLFVKHGTITFTCFQKEMEAHLNKSLPNEAIETAKPPQEALSLSAFRKYVKTLRFLGCTIKTINQGKVADGSTAEKSQAYQLEQHPFPWVPTQADWLFFLQLLAHCSAAERAVLSPLVWSLPPSLSRQFSSANLLNNKKLLERQIPSFLRKAFSEDLQNCIQTIEAIQQAGDGILLWLTQPSSETTPFTEQGGVMETTAIRCHNRPFLSGIVQQLELKEQGSLLLRVEDVQSYQQYLVPLSIIKGGRRIPIEQLAGLHPQVVEPVYFKLSGKLVDSYEQRANETILETGYCKKTESIEFLLIEARQVTVASLFQRLKRYGQYAELLKPLALRNQFAEQLKQQRDLL